MNPAPKDDFIIPKELQWMESIGAAPIQGHETVADKIADIHSTQYSQASISSARRLWTKMLIHSTHAGTKYKQLLDAIYARNTIVSIALVCYYCKKVDPRELTCQDLERFFQTTSDVLSTQITDETLPLSDAHLRLLLQHLLSNDSVRLAFFEFIYTNNTSEQGVNHISYENTCRVLLVFFPKHKILTEFLEFLESSGTRTLGKYLWPMIYNFLSMYPSVDAIRSNYNFSASIYPPVIDSFCKKKSELSYVGGGAAVSDRSIHETSFRDIAAGIGVGSGSHTNAGVGISLATKKCLENIDAVLAQGSDPAGDSLASHSMSLSHHPSMPHSEQPVRTPNVNKRVQFAGFFDESSISFVDQPSPPKPASTAPPVRTEIPRRASVSTPVTEAKRDRPPSALSQKQVDLAARLAAFKAASSQRRILGSASAGNLSSATIRASDPSFFASPSATFAPTQQQGSASSDALQSLTKKLPDNQLRPMITAVHKGASYSAQLQDSLAASALMGPQDKGAQHPLVKNPYVYVAPVAAIIAEARKAAQEDAQQNKKTFQHIGGSLHSQTHSQALIPQVSAPQASAPGQPSAHAQAIMGILSPTGNIVAATPMRATLEPRQLVHVAPELPASAVTPSAVNQHTGIASQTPLQQPRLQYPASLGVASKYISKAAMPQEPNCIAVQPAISAAAPTHSASTSLTPMLAGPRRLSATAAKYINAQVN